MKSKVDGAKAALVIVDVQKAFSVPPKIVEGIRRYAGRFERRVFTQFVNPPGSLFRKSLDQHSSALGSEDVKLLVEPRPADLVIVKAGYGLQARDLRRIKNAGVQRAIVCGIDTDACVLAVMFSLFDAGIECHAKENLCWSSTGLHRAGLEIIRAQFPAPR